MDLDQSLVNQILERQKLVSSEISEMGKHVPNHLLAQAEGRLEKFVAFRLKFEQRLKIFNVHLDEFKSLFQNE